MLENRQALGLAATDLNSISRSVSCVILGNELNEPLRARFSASKSRCEMKRGTGVRGGCSLAFPSAKDGSWDETASMDRAAHGGCSASSRSSEHACGPSTVTESYHLPVAVTDTRDLAMSKTESRDPCALVQGEQK